MTEEFLDELIECHGDNTVVNAVINHFKMIAAKIEAAGPYVDPKFVKKLDAHDGLGEGRYNQGRGPAWRFFFKFGTLNGKRVAVFADMDSKSRHDFSHARYRKASQRVDAAFEGEGVKRNKAW